MVVTTRFIRELALASPSDADNARHISAASGMVVVGKFLYVIADDELHLGVFDGNGAGAGSLARLFPGELPDSAAERKALKPDLEALVRLPSFPGYPHGALLALASGSKPNRRTGALLKLDEPGRIAGEPRPYDLTFLYSSLESRFPALNIEGAVVLGDELILLQRGSKAQPESALISFPLREIFRAANPEAENVSPIAASRVQSFDLGAIEGAPLSFTDGAALPDGRIVFSAVAENTEDSYLDGPCLGAAIGIIGADGRVETMLRLEPIEKVEGIHATVQGDRICLLLVTDADDASVPAKLLGVGIPA
ncbi:DUF6929 family protein [Pseudoxanthomonas sacheonensis]|uniref:Uncharacterized protein n=1 Tax=Pseudoxanthomonas sacheonensis TaxID=443615 RepID=A0ABU1RP99_9GAMM|nr:hypothetical protein [Pseudoxanthomonas sacheonensis]MDR6840593.1 hypothetical protein [Pseudoxanthomonas sacheonensis]